MKNIYVEKMKLVLESYYELQKMVNAEMQKNLKTYSPEYADEQNRILRQKKEKNYEDAKNEIVKIFTKIRELLSRGNAPVGEEMNEHDISLLRADVIELSDDEVVMMARKYRDSANFTMMRVLHTWCQRNGRDDIKIFLPIDQLRAYEKICKSALYIAGQIYADRNIMIDPIEITTFGDPTGYAREYEIIGDGKQLQELAFKGGVSDEQLHIFDHITISPAIDYAESSHLH